MKMMLSMWIIEAGEKLGLDINSGDIHVTVLNWWQLIYAFMDRVASNRRAQSQALSDNIQNLLEL